MNGTNVLIAACILGAVLILVALLVLVVMSFGGAAYHLENEKPAHIFLPAEPGAPLASGTPIECVRERT